MSIGHALIDEALYEGFETTVRRYVHTVERLPAAWEITSAPSRRAQREAADCAWPELRTCARHVAN